MRRVGIMVGRAATIALRSRRYRYPRLESCDDFLEAVMVSGEGIVPLESEIVKAGGVCFPTCHIRFLAAHNMSGGAHLDAATTQRPIDQRDFQLNGHARLHLARRQKIDSAGAYISGDERNGEWFDVVADARKA